MGKMLNFEFRKLFRSKSFYICTIVLIIGCILNLCLCLAIEHFTKESYGYTAVELTMSSVISSVIDTVLAIFISIFVCSDYGDGTLKTVYARGNSRTSFYWAKFITVAVSSLIMFVLLIATTFFMSWIFWEKGSGPSGRQILAIFTQYLLVLAIASVYQFFSHLISKLGGAIPVNIFVFGILSLGTSIIDIIMDSEKIQLSKWLPESCISLISSDFVVMDQVYDGLYCAAGYIIVFGLLGWWASSKKEV